MPVVEGRPPNFPIAATMASSENPSGVSSLFSKKKGKKGKKGPKAYNLNLDSGITKPE